MIEPSTSPIVPITLVPIAFILLWLFVVRLVSYLGGWRMLADSYATQHHESDGLLKRKSAIMRYHTQYQAAIHLKGTYEGLYLVTVIFFRTFHPPMLIPWDRVLEAEINKQFFTMVKLRIATSHYSDEQSIVVSVYGRGVAEHLRPFLEDRGLLSAETPQS